jgi:ribose 5-phosphate isomerase B
MKICIASDHRGFKLKNELLNYLKENYIIDDLGTYSEESVDYTKYAFLLGEKIRDHLYDFGIAICGSGIGISIACNKVKGVRCAKINTVSDARLTRNDNDANVIALSGSLDFEEAKVLVDTFLTTPFSNLERYNKRINDITKYENGEYYED